MTHTIHRAHRHAVWDNSILPVLTIVPGEKVELDIVEASDGQVTLRSTARDIDNLNPARANPVTGPVYVDGAQPGDALRVKILELQPSGWGWTANIPNFGLLADDFSDSALHLWRYDPISLAPAAYGKHAKVPLKPFIGTIGVAPAEPGQHSTIPPRRVGGNMDLRDLVAGTELILPIECPGALFSAGDTHAAQGDGEVCGTAIESPMKALLEFEIIKDAAPRFPRLITAGPVTRHLDERGYFITTGIGPDLAEGAKNAVREMIDLLTREENLPPIDAYMLCSVCADLRISQIVDAPNWTVSYYFPRMVF